MFVTFYKSHISRWIVEVVKSAYLTHDQVPPERVTAHELRALSPSWAYNCHIALEDVMSAAFWSSAGVFQRNYLWDLALIAESMATLCLVVAAQHVFGR